MPASTDQAPVRMNQHTVEFHDHNADWVHKVETINDETRNVAATPNMSIAQYFARPRQIWSGTWNNTLFSSTKALVINPWINYFSAQNVTDKLESYAQMRCKLKLKIVVNGNGFLYGNMAVYYHPLTFRDVDAGYSTLGPRVNYAHEISFTNPDYVRHSQKPHAYLVPAESLGCTLELPFLWDRNWLDLTNQDVAKMGNIIMYALNPLKFLSGGTSPEVDLVMFAWCEDMELSMVTDKPINIWNSSALPPWPATPLGPTVSSARSAVSHAGYEDEYGKGPVSKVANSCALAAHSVSKVPLIGPYASATAAVFGSLGSLAALFGFSRPAIIKDISPYKPMYMGNLANTDAGDTCQKLSLDSKQEVTVDPRVVGLNGIDEMTISSIAGRESYWRTFEWSYNVTQGTRLCLIAVNPEVCRASGTSTADQYRRRLNLTGSCYATVPFGAWRGTMRYRFQIIASQFHRGRLRILWDPREVTETVSRQKDVEPYNYSKVIDLANCRDFTIDVGWGQDTSFLPTPDKPGSPLWSETSLFCGNAGNISNLDTKHSNGILGIYVLNSLVSTANDGVDGQPIQINIFTSCVDLEVANPLTDVINKYVFSYPQFDAVPTPPSGARKAVSHAGFEEDDTDDHAPTRGAMQWQFGPKLVTYDEKTQYVFYGDPIVSLRTLMKRYAFYVAYPLLSASSDVTQHTLNIYCLPDYPISPGSVPYGNNPPCTVSVSNNPSAATGHFGYCFAQQNYLTFYSPAYLCRRGAIRWKYLTEHQAFIHLSATNNTTGLPTIFTATRGSFPRNFFNKALYPSDGTANDGGTVMRSSHSYFDDGVGGQAVTATSKNPVLELELPFYNYLRFAPTQTFEETTLTADKWTETINNDPHHTLRVPIVGRAGECSEIFSYVAAGDDYTLSMYLGPPVMYYCLYMGNVEPTFNKLPFSNLR